MRKHPTQLSVEQVEAFSQCAACRFWKVWLKLIDDEDVALDKELRQPINVREADLFAKGQLETLSWLRSHPDLALKAIEKAKEKESKR